MEDHKLTQTEKLILTGLGILLGLAMMSGMVSCDQYTPTPAELNSPKTIYKIDDSHPLEVVVVDSCEYLYGNWGYGTVLSHKGNCKNPTHKH